MRQRGIALLAILLVVSIVTVLAVGIAQSNMVRLGLTERRQQAAQAWLIWQAGVEWSRDVLRMDLLRNRYDYPNEFWGRGIRNYPAEGAKLSGIMIDQQGLYNLNNLVRNGQVSEPDLAIYRRLLSRLQLDPSLADSLVDWMDADHVARPGGAEDQFYATRDPPYRAADAPLNSMADLYWVRGYNAATIARLRPYVTVLPMTTQVNVNSASRLLLSVLLPDLDAGQVAQLWHELQAKPCANMSAFGRLLPKDVFASSGVMGVASHFFLLKLVVIDGDTRAEGEALLERMFAMPTVVWRRRGLEKGLVIKNPLTQAELTGGV